MTTSRIDHHVSLEDVERDVRRNMAVAETSANDAEMSARYRAAESRIADAMRFTKIATAGQTDLTAENHLNVRLALIDEHARRYEAKDTPGADAVSMVIRRIDLFIGQLQGRVAT